MAKPDTAFWLIDDGRDFSIQLKEGTRFPTMAAANAERRPDQGLWEVTRRSSDAVRIGEVH
jgi:hypothetical protein